MREFRRLGPADDNNVAVFGDLGDGLCRDRAPDGRLGSVLIDRIGGRLPCQASVVLDNWMGTDQVRYLKMDQGRLVIDTAPLPGPDSKIRYKITLVWQRAE